MTETPRVIDAEDLSDDDKRWLVAQGELEPEDRTIPHELHPGTRNEFTWYVFHKPVAALMQANGIDPATVAADGLHLVGDQLTYERQLRDADGKVLTRLVGEGQDLDVEVVTRTTTVTVQR